MGTCRVSSHVKTSSKLGRACGLPLRHRFVFKAAARGCSDDRLVGKHQATLLVSVRFGVGSAGEEQ